ncbi:MAG: formylglycine-generating enzyme family protein [Planctomycetota bacterium]
MQNPFRAGWRRDHFEELELETCGRQRLVISTQDWPYLRPVYGAKVSIPGFETQETPAVYADLSCRGLELSGWVEKDGYIAMAFTVSLEPEPDPGPVEEDGDTVYLELALHPVFAVVQGRIAANSTIPREAIRVGYELADALEPPRNVAEEPEVRPSETGEFSLVLPVGRSWRIAVFYGGQVLATREVNDAKPLESWWVWDPEEESVVDREPYRVGTITVSFPGSEPTAAQFQFEDSLERGRVESENEGFAEARHMFGVASELVEHLPERWRPAMQQRVLRALDWVASLELRSEEDRLETAAREALFAGGLDQAEALAQRALQLTPALDWPRELLDEVEGLRLRQEVERRRSAAEAAKAGRTLETLEAGAAPLLIDGFMYRGKKAQGMHEYVHDATGLEFVYIPGGTFAMGSALDEKDRCQCETQHQVTLSPYLIAKYEVSQEVWERVMGRNPSGFKKGGRYPVENLFWYEALRFCVEVGLELPTEAQWEFACRAGTTTPFAFGSNITTDQVNYDGDFPYGDAPKGESREETVPVDSFQPNAWGLHNMPGNVWEWCWDCHEVLPSLPVTDPRGPSPDAGISFVTRGGAWTFGATMCRSAARYNYVPSYNGYNQMGFRPAKSLP